MLNEGAGRRRRGAASENFPCGESDCVCSRNKSVCVFYDDNHPRHFCSRGWMEVEGVYVMMTGDFVLSSHGLCLELTLD